MPPTRLAFLIVALLPGLCRSEPSPGDVALLVDGTEEARRAIEPGLTQWLVARGGRVREVEEARAARAFVGLAGASLDEAGVARIREHLGVDRLYVVRTMIVGERLYLEAFSASSAGVSRLFGETSAARVADEAIALVASLPAKPAPPATAAVAPPKERAASQGALPRLLRRAGLSGERPPGRFVEIRGTGGLKQLEGEVYGPVKSQTDVGVEATWGGRDWGLGIATDFSYSRARGERDGVEWRGSTMEIPLGLRAFSDNHPVRFFVGGGWVIMNSYLVLDDGVDTDYDIGQTSGWWLSGGALYRAGKSGHVGAEVRYSAGDAHVFDELANAGGLHVLFTAGFGFGSAGNPK